MEGKFTITVPSLICDEAGNILLFACSRPATDEAAQALSDLHALPLEVVTPATDDAQANLRLAALCGITYYDATYLALARTRDCPLITADARLVRRAETSDQVLLPRTV